MLISLLVTLILLMLVYWAIHQLAGTFGLSPQILVVVDVLLVVLFVVYMLSLFGLVSVPLRVVR